MNPEELPSLLLATLKKNLLVSGLILLGVTFLVIGLFQIFSSPKNDIEFQQASNKPDTSTSTGSEIVADVSGAVMSPGVYKFKSGARIQDALVSAGGLSSSADRDYVSKSINLASPLKDGVKIYIPKVGDAVKAVPQSSSVLSASTQGISINNSTSEELDSLPGVGPVTAKKIIEARPYSSIEELQERKIVSAKVYNEIKDKIGL